MGCSEGVALSGDDQAVTPEPAARWKQVKALFTLTLEKPPPLREAFLAEACGEDAALRTEVETLLSAHRDAGAFFESAPGHDDHASQIPSGTRLGPYEIVDLIGAGGMGQVYRARDARLGRDVAIKVVPASGHREQALQRFAVEARAAGSINHPNILAVHDVGTYEGGPYLVLELLEGQTLREMLGGRPLSLGKALDLAVQLAQGLSAAHDHGVVHRDLKPENLLVTSEGRLKILDFGIAKLVADGAPEGRPGTLTGSVMGTVGYMSPEQVRGERADHRSDLFAFGLILHEMLTGELAFKRPSTVETGSAILNEEPPRLPESVPPEFARLVRRCLEKEPEKRFQSAGELLSALQSKEVATVARRRWPLLLVVLLLLALIALLAQRLRQPPVVAGQPKGRRAVAVLGFKNNAGRLESAWLGTALSEMIVSELAAGENLRTVPGESVARMKIELALADADSFATDTLARIRAILAADAVVTGAYTALGPSAGGKLRLDVRLQETASGESLIAIAENGTEADLLDLVSRIGTRLREKLGARALTVSEAGTVRASLPAGAEAARLYAEGLQKLRSFDTLAARDLLEKAVALDPAFPLAHAALAQAWADMGYDAKSTEEAKIAFERSGSLSREERLLVEGHYREASGNSAKALEIYHTLFDFFPDNLEYGLRLAALQQALDPERHAGAMSDYLVTLRALRSLPPPARDDPRIDLDEIDALESFDDKLRALANVARKAEAQGSRLLLASARLDQGFLQFFRGEMDQGQSAAEEARRLYWSVGHKAGEGRALYLIAAYDHARADLSSALEHFGAALALSKETGSRQGEAEALGGLALAHATLGDPRLAVKLAVQDAALQPTSGETDWAKLFHGLARLRGGDTAAGGEEIEDALATWAKLGTNRVVALRVSAYARLAKGDLAGARTRIEEGLAEAERLKSLSVGSKIRLLAARLALEEGHPAEAEALGRKAMAAFHAMGSPAYEAEAGGLLARALLASGKSDEALSVLNEARTLAGGTQWRGTHLSTTIAAARIDAAMGRAVELKSDRRRLEELLADAVKWGCVDDAFEARLALGELELASGQAAAARVHLAALEKEARAKGFGLIARKALESRVAGQR
jgi:eukaryotic-like serine/threonine-protein kinase